MKKWISLVLSLLLVISAMTAAVAEQPEELWDEEHLTVLMTDGAVYGEGGKEFTFTVVYKWMETITTIRTDAETVGEALLNLSLIAGEEGPYGLYVKTVNGITADYNVDGSYWAFYIDGEYAMTGVDTTPIAEGASYTLAVEGLQWEMEEGQTILLRDGRTYGEGDGEFLLTVTNGEDTVTVTIRTDAETVGEALTKLYIISGEEGQYGLYVKTVSGITADYSVDGSYWAFYIDGEYAMTGVDTTPITPGAVYTLAVEKG